MNFKNLAENLIIVLISVAIGGAVGYQASTLSNKQTIELLTPTIKEAIRKETTSISNEFKTEIKKLKTRGAGITTLEIEPILDNEIVARVPEIDTIATKPKKKPKRKKFLGIF